MSKSKKWNEFDDEEFVTDKRTRKQQADRRKKKRMKNALRAGDVDQLRHMEDYDEYY